MEKDYYKILGVQKKSSKDEIKKAYRTLSMKYHPDKNPNDATCVSKFQEINEAYEILGDESKRNEYDMINSNPFLNMMKQGSMGGGSMGPMSGFGGMGGLGGVHMGDIDEIFNAFFGGNSNMEDFMQFQPNIQVFHNGRPVHTTHLQKPSPIIKTVTITMEQVLTGANIPIDIERWIHENERWNHENNNKIYEKETVYIDIPKGIDDNEIILIKNKGNVLNENVKGDVKVFIKIENNTHFKRSGLDLLINQKITLKEALCGFKFELKYINNKVYTLNNNFGHIIVPGYKKIIPNMGLTRENHTGNLIITFNVEFPKELTVEQMDVLRETL